MNLNRVELIGSLGCDPKTTYTPNGNAVATVSLVTETSSMNGSKRQERTDGIAFRLGPSWANTPQALKRARTCASEASSAVGNIRPKPA